MARTGSRVWPPTPGVPKSNPATAIMLAGERIAFRHDRPLGGAGS